MKIPATQGGEEEDKHRQPAISSKLTRCEENNSVGRVASDHKVSTICLFVYHRYE
jgi:hypothetical protein